MASQKQALKEKESGSEREEGNWKSELSDSGWQLCFHVGAIDYGLLIFGFTCTVGLNI